MENVSIAIIICTYKREQYVIKNINVLKNYCKDVIKHVYVIDNGQTLDPNKLSDDFVHVISNKNLGGSGGYARGMYEAKKSSNCSHIFLMDDDIEFTPETIHKAYNILCGFREEDKEDWIGFGNVTFDNPDKLVECGCYYDGIKLHALNRGIKLSNTKSLLKIKKYNYSAWWSIIMPISVIDKYGYPYPFFIKFDDVEYSLRRKKEKIHFYKELYVKHEAFKKKYNWIIEYYSLKNALITNTLHMHNPLLKCTMRYFFRFIKLYFTFNFKGIKMANLGLYHFLYIHNNIDIFPDYLKNELNKKDFCALISFICFPLIAFKNIFLLLINFNKIQPIYKNFLKKFKLGDFWINRFDGIDHC